VEPSKALQRFIRFVMRDTLYHGKYSAEVQSQSDDDSLDLLPDDNRVRGNGLSRVPIRHGLPGVRVRVRVGSRVQLGFENGDPTQPYAALWEPGAIETIIFDNGTQPIARMGDTVTCFWPSGTFDGLLNGNEFHGTVMFGNTSPGIIDGGKDNVKA
jgi:hypothetical protein